MERFNLPRGGLASHRSQSAVRTRAELQLLALNIDGGRLRSNATGTSAVDDPRDGVQTSFHPTARETSASQPGPLRK